MNTPTPAARKPTAAQINAVAEVWRREMTGKPIAPRTGNARRCRAGQIRIDVQHAIMRAGWVKIGPAPVADDTGRVFSGVVTTEAGRRMVADST